MDYTISIDSKKGVKFSRWTYRRNHDHNDKETLQILTKDQDLHKKGDLVWRSRGAFRDEGYETFYVHFGSVTKSY